MSANTSIAEGGKARPFGRVKALMVEGEDGKFYPWFPENDRALDSLSVTENGVYQASKLGIYGWDRVYANVPTKGITGKDPDTGEEVYVHPDPETGELVEDVLPVRIEVTTPPTKTEYTDGETIDYSGIVVHAFSANGQDIGAIPVNKLIFPVSVTDSDAAVVSPVCYSVLNLDGMPTNFHNKLPINATMCGFAEETTYYPYKEKYCTYFYGWDFNEKTYAGGVGFSSPPDTSSGRGIVVLVTQTENRLEFIVASEYLLPHDTLVAIVNRNIGSDYISAREILTIQNYTLNEKTVYYVTYADNGVFIPYVDQSDSSNFWVSAAEDNSPYAAWIAIYGEATQTGGIVQTVPVQYQREDGVVLETSFGITLIGISPSGQGDD